MRRLLTIAFDFPPRRTSGTYRITGLAKYILRHDWEPCVLTVKGAAGAPEDPELLQRIPSGVRVVRTGYLRVSGWEGTASRGARSLGVLRPKVDERHEPRMDRLLRSLGEFLRSCLYFPDEKIGWLPFALARALRLRWEQGFDALYTTSPPRSALVIGLLLKVLFGVPWVAELRDPWYPSRRTWRRRFERWLQMAIYRRADALVVMTNEHLKDLTGSYHVPESKLVIIPNGYDEDDFSPDGASPSFSLPTGYIHLSHFGAIYPNCSGGFFPVLAEVVQERPDLRERLRVNIFGFPDETVQRYAAHGGLEGIIQLHGFIRHSAALEAMQASDCLLLFLANPEMARLVVSAKTYEYLRVGRPILAVAYEGGVKRLIEEGQAGWVVDPEDTQTMKQVLQTLLGEGRRKEEPRSVQADFVAQFRYDRLAGRLASVLDKVVSHVR